jgi:CRP/FNR family transcriptional regulator
VSWDRASLQHKAARSVLRDDWEQIERGWDGSRFREASSPSGAAHWTDGLRSEVKRPSNDRTRGASNDQYNQVGGSEADPSPDIEQNRLIPGYCYGDRRIGAGRELFGIGSPLDSIFNLIDGWVALYTLLEDGRRQIVQFALPGAVLGVLPDDGACTTFGAHALTDTMVPHGTLSSAIRDDPGVSMRLARSLARDCSLAYDHMTSIGRRSARERVAYLLLELFIRYRAQWPGNRVEEMSLPLTQEQIGDATGLTFVHVNRVLGVLRREGILEFHYRRLRILDPDKLIEVAGIDPQIAITWLIK